MEALESEKGEGTLNYLKMFSGEDIPAAAKPATKLQEHDAQSRTRGPWGRSNPYCGQDSGFPSSIN